MPKRVFNNPGISQTITRPVVLDIARQVFEMTGLPKDTRILYPDSEGAMQQPASSISNDPEFNTFSSGKSFFIQVEESYQQDRIMSTAVYYPDSPFIFSDPQTKVYIRPVYSPTDITLTITYRATDKDSAVRWRDDIRNRVSMMREVRVHQISYSYLFDKMVLETLTQIHSMQETVAPYNRTLDQYLNTCFDSRARILTTLAGTVPTWGVAETQARVLGYFDFEGYPEEGTKEDSNASWIINFGYKIKFDKPNAVVMEYPLMIHNQLIDEKYRQIAPPARIEDYQSTYSWSASSLNSFEVTNPNVSRTARGVVIPDIDEFIPAQSSVPFHTSRIATILTSIDPVNPLNLLDLKDLGEYELSAALIDFLKIESAYLHRVGSSLFNISVYKGDVLMSPEDFFVSPDAVVTLKYAPDMRQVYHVRFSVFDRPRLMPQRARESMRNNCSLITPILKALSKEVSDKSIISQCLPGNVIKKTEFNEALEIIDKKYDPNRTNAIYQFNTVMSLGVIARRRT